MKFNLPRGSIFIIAAVTAGLVATVAIRRYVTMKTKVPVTASRQVIVAAHDIAPGTPLTGQIVKSVTWPQAVVPPKAASTLNQIDGRVVNVPIPQGNPILFSMLFPEGTAAGLSGILAEGQRALTVRVDEVAGVAGFIHPGDHVDVLVDLPIVNARTHLSKTILHDITVLTTGQVWHQSGDNKPMVVNTVTLEVTPQQSEVLNLASNEGKIRLALRNRNNKTITQTKGVTTDYLTGDLGKKEEKVAAKTNPKEKCVEVIKGLDRSEAKL